LPGVTVAPAKTHGDGLVVGITDLPLTDGITLSASLALKLGSGLTLEISGFSLDELSFTVDGGESGTVQVKGEGSTACKAAGTVGPLDYPPLVFFIGAFPIVLVPHVDLIVGADGEAHARFATSATEDASFRVGFGYAGGSVGAIKEGTSAGSVQPPTLVGTS